MSFATLLKMEMAGLSLYSRGLNPTVDILRKNWRPSMVLKIVSSLIAYGAAAIFAGVLANYKAGDHIVSVKAPYTWAQKCLM